jgi:hypothetical protein
MRAKPDTGPALDANYRTAVPLVKVDDLNHALFGAVAASDTFFAVKPDTAFRTWEQRFGQADGGTGSVQAATADISGQLGLQPASGPNLDGAATGAIAFVNHAGAGQHARITADTTVHTIGLQNFTRHATTPYFQIISVASPKLKKRNCSRTA